MLVSRVRIGEQGQVKMTWTWLFFPLLSHKLVTVDTKKLHFWNKPRAWPILNENSKIMGPSGKGLKRSKCTKHVSNTPKVKKIEKLSIWDPVRNHEFDPLKK